MRKNIMLVLMMLVVCTSAATAERKVVEVPRTGSKPVIDGKLMPGEWDKAVKLTGFTKLMSTKPAEQQTEVYLSRDNGFLYCGIVCRDEDVAELMSRREELLKKKVWRVPRMELIFGDGMDGDGFTQIITDFSGRIYKSFKELFNCKVAYGNNRWSVEYAIPLALLRRLPESDYLTAVNFFRGGEYVRKHPDPNKSLSAWSSHQSARFADQSGYGWLLLETPAVLVQKECDKLLNIVESWRKVNVISEADTKKLESAISARAGKPVELTEKSVKSFYNDLGLIEEDINAHLEQSFAKSNKTGRIPLLNAFTSETALPEKWLTKKIFGKDFWFLIYNSGKYKKMNLPYFKESMCLVPSIGWWNKKDSSKISSSYRTGSDRTGSDIFFHFYPGISEALAKPGGPFGIFCIAQPLDKKYKFPKELIQEIIEKYCKNPRFAGFFTYETVTNWRAHGGKDGYKIFKELKIKKPSNRKEAYESVKKAYFHTGSTAFRSWARSNPELRKWGRSNPTATFLDHVVLSFGDNMNGHEVGGETTYNLPLSIAFSRGAARQYGKPWISYFAWNARRGGNRARTIMTNANLRGRSIFQGISTTRRGTKTRFVFDTPQTMVYRPGGHYMVGPKLGVGLETQKRVLLCEYMAGTNIMNDESSSGALQCNFDYKTIDSIDPLVINLRDHRLYVSDFADLRAYIYDNIVKKRDRGTAITPVALLFDRYHGYVPIYSRSKVWEWFEPSEMEKTMWAMDETLYPRHPETESLRTSPYGDIFDVLTNDADTKMLDTYKVILPVGDVTIDKAFASRLVDYVRQGGTIILNVKNLPTGNLFPADFLGCEVTGKTAKSRRSFSFFDNKTVIENMPFTYQIIKPINAKTAAVTVTVERNPLILVNGYGKGRVILTAPHYMKPRDSMTSMLKLFDNLMRAIRDEVLPLKVEGPMQYAINRNKNGWVISLFNHHGTPPKFHLSKFYVPNDPTQVRQARITFPKELGKVKQVIDWWTGKDVPFKRNAKGTTLTTTLPGGDAKILEFVIKKR